MFYLGKCDILGKKEGENMPFETLKKSHVKRNIIIGVLVVGIISAIILQFTRAKYRVTESIPLVNGTINYTLPDLNIIGLYVDGEEATELDSSKEYTLDTSKSTCTYKDGSAISNLSINYDSDTKELQITPFTTKGTKCYLYFDEAKALLNETVLANATSKLTRSSFTSTVTNTTTGTIYYEDTSKGRTYYFAGNPTDNWVSFGGFYWRIIRINEDGTIRLIYQGTSANTTGSGTQIGTSDFSRDNLYNNNMYVGYMYQSNQVHGLTTDSLIKDELDEWYQNNLTEVSDKIDGNAGFCGDRYPSTSYTTSNGSGGTGTTTTYYGASIRLTQSNVTPTFECIDEDGGDSDLYTTEGSSGGNKALTYPIGLITADEVAYAGGVNGSTNESYYLYTGSAYWTMSPFICPNANVFYVRSSGTLSNNLVNNTWGVRPVINLKANVQITGGNGSSSSPYVISQS